jgi:hypothetical protein
MALADGLQVVTPGDVAEICRKWNGFLVVLENWRNVGSARRAVVMIFCCDVVGVCTKIAQPGASNKS